VIAQLNPVVAKLLLLAHAISAGVLLGSTTHFALQVYAQRSNRANPRLLRLYPTVALTTWALTFALGAVLYPRYRVLVRNDVLDREAVWASILFDCKENAALLVGTVILAAFMQRVRTPQTRADRRVALALGLAPAVLCWFVAIAGVLVTSVKGV
jgi:hypothetical protein